MRLDEQCWSILAIGPRSGRGSFDDRWHARCVLYGDREGERARRRWLTDEYGHDQHILGAVQSPEVVLRRRTDPVASAATNNPSSTGTAAASTSDVDGLLTSTGTTRTSSESSGSGLARGRAGLATAASCRKGYEPSQRRPTRCGLRPGEFMVEDAVVEQGSVQVLSPSSDRSAVSLDTMGESYRDSESEVTTPPPGSALIEEAEDEHTHPQKHPVGWDDLDAAEAERRGEGGVEREADEEARRARAMREALELRDETNTISPCSTTCRTGYVAHGVSPGVAVRTSTGGKTTNTA